MQRENYNSSCHAIYKYHDHNPKKIKRRMNYAHIHERKRYKCRKWKRHGGSCSKYIITSISIFKSKICFPNFTLLLWLLLLRRNSERIRLRPNKPLRPSIHHLLLYNINFFFTSLIALSAPTSFWNSHPFPLQLRYLQPLSLKHFQPSLSLILPYILLTPFLLHSSKPLIRTTLSEITLLPSSFHLLIPFHHPTLNLYPTPPPM